MISGATHALSQDLMLSMQQFRSQLEEQRNMSVKVDEVSESDEPEVTEPVENTEAPQEPEDAKIDYDALKADIDSRRESARQAAVHVADLKHQQNMVDTYINASSDEDEQSGSSIKIEPADVYKTSMHYSQNMALIEAFESVASETSDRVHVSVLV